MKKLLIALVLLSIAGAGVYLYLKYQKTDDKATVQQSPISTGDIIQQVQATGTLEALRTVQVGSQVSGTVSWLGADFNSIVKEGQVIAKLDPSLLQVQVDVQEANIQRQQGDIENQKVQLENDQKNLERTQAQSDKGLVSPQQLETAKLQVKTRQANINSAEKQLVQAEAQLNQAKLNVSYCTIKAPIDGVIVDRRVDVGVTVQSSMTTPQFFTIATDLTTLKLSAGVDEADIGYIRRNMEVTFTVDSYPGVNFVGTVDAVRLNATTNQNVVTYPVWITVQNPDLRLRPSMTASLKIIVDRASNVMRVPNQALRFRPTTDIYTWLGMTPPAAGQGRGRGANAVVDATGARGGNVQAAGAARTAGPEPAGGQRGGDLQANAGTGGGNPNRRQRTQGGQTQLQEQPPGGPGTPGDGRQGQGGQGGGGQNRQTGQGGGGQNRQAGQGDSQNRQGQGRGQFGGGQGGQNGEMGGQGGRGGGRGFGAPGMPNMTPEQQAQFRQQFGGRSGRGGGAGGGRGNRQAANAVTGDMTPITERNASQIDDLFAQVQKRIQPGQVWIYDEKNPDPQKKLRQINVRLGLTDGQFSELISSNETFTPGVTQVVTGVVPPPSALPKPGTNSIFNQQRGFGPGGFGPNPGGGGDRGPGGGGGGPRGGGGGGGRGGN